MAQHAYGKARGTIKKPAPAKPKTKMGAKPKSAKVSKKKGNPY